MPIKLPFCGRRAVAPDGPLDAVPELPGDALQQELDKNQRICSRCGHHFRLRVDARIASCSTATRSASRTPGSNRWTCSASSTRSRTPSGSQPRASARASATPRSGARARCRRHEGRDVRDGLRVHGRLDGHGRRREGHARGRIRARRAAAADRRVGLGRRADAGGHAVADAARQDASPRSAAWPMPACPSSA